MLNWASLKNTLSNLCSILDEVPALLLALSLLFTLVFFVFLAAAGTFITEYIGEVISNEEADTREALALAQAAAADAAHGADEPFPRNRPPEGDCYMFRLDAEWVIDATRAGSLARFINHSCDPNCYTRVVLDGLGRRHVCIYAKRDISKGTELSYDYCFVEDPGLPPLPCNCGAAACTGRMDRPAPLQPPEV